MVGHQPTRQYVYDVLILLAVMLSRQSLHKYESCCEKGCLIAGGQHRIHGQGAR